MSKRTRVLLVRKARSAFAKLNIQKRQPICKADM